MNVEARVIPEEINEEDDESAIPDHKHVRPMVTGCIRTKYYCEIIGYGLRSSLQQCLGSHAVIWQLSRRSCMYLGCRILIRDIL
jgi:hypothetical protein